MSAAVGMMVKSCMKAPAAYSDLCVDSDMNISCLYERGERGAYETLSFAKFDLAWLTDGEDTLT